MHINFFGAKWCNPCKMMKLVVEKLREEGHVIHYIDAEDNVAMMEEFGVRTVPTFVKIIGGKEVDRKTGPMNIDVFREWVQ